MRYKCGLYGGNFNPMHVGHVQSIIQAANQCEQLIIAIRSGGGKSELDLRLRYRWVYQVIQHLDNVRIFTGDSAQKIRDFAGAEIDALFCGGDLAEDDSFWAKRFPDAELCIFPPAKLNSAEIRKNPLAHWDALPTAVRPYYVKKVLIIGGESTGKSTLSINLANYFCTNFLEEVGRPLSERSGTSLMMLPADYTDILLQHKNREIEALERSNRVLFEDTDCLVTLFYLDFLEGGDKPNEQLADAIAHLNRYDLILFLEPDVAFVKDGLRSDIIAADRETYSRQIKEIYTRYGFSFVSLSGDYQARFEKAVELVSKLIGEKGESARGS
ncbi:MAG: AAA family ATPase [Firmicutes bacterium]|nr:AAA family ATPase [Bacillota bacterium]